MIADMSLAERDFAIEIQPHDARDDDPKHRSGEYDFNQREARISMRSYLGHWW